MTERDDEFLMRWSRRKLAARKYPTAVQEEDRAKNDLETVQVVEEEEHLELEVATEEDLLSPNLDENGETKPVTSERELDESEFDDVDFEQLDYSSNYERFMVKGVPEAIQRKALRKLWASNPLLANIDGLNDYDDDFTDAALAVDVIKSAYQVGRGYLTDEELTEIQSGDKGDTDEAHGTDEQDVAKRGDANNDDVEQEASSRGDQIQEKMEDKSQQDNIDGKVDNENTTGPSKPSSA